MWIPRLELESLRNIERLGVDLSPGFNFFFGANGAGKTAILEAVHVLARGRSFRASHINDLIQMGHEGLVIRALAEDEHIGSRRLVFARTKAGGTDVRIDGATGRRMSQISVLFPLEVMTPSMVDLVFGGPALRREWLDWGVFHVKPDFLPISRRYVAALRQRNASLKAIAAGRIRVPELEPWTHEVARLGVLVDRARREHLEDMAGRIGACLAALSSGFDIEVTYRQGWALAQDLANVLGESVAREVKSGSTLAGPHRADLELRVEGQLCSATLSRGQAKVLASALMLAQADGIRANGRRTGLFLIDDIGAELDDRHRMRLFEALVERDCQVLATSVGSPEAGVLDRCRAYSLFHVERGVARRV